MFLQAVSKLSCASCSNVFLSVNLQGKPQNDTDMFPRDVKVQHVSHGQFHIRLEHDMQTFYRFSSETKCFVYIAYSNSTSRARKRLVPRNRISCEQERHNTTFDSRRLKLSFEKSTHVNKVERNL